MLPPYCIVLDQCSNDRPSWAQCGHSSPSRAEALATSTERLPPPRGFPPLRDHLV